MAKEMVYFNATKQIETITIHYNSKLDGAFVDDVAQSIKDIAKKMSKVNLKKPREVDSIQVFVYPSKKLFYKVFAGEIEKRFYSRRRSLEDLYVVQDSEENIHIVSPRGMTTEKRESFKKILVMKVLEQYMDEKEKQSAERLLKEAMKPKEKEKDDIEEEEIEQDDEPEIEELEDIEEPAEELEEELDEDEIEDIIETELVIEQIDEEQEAEIEEEYSESEQKEEKRSEAQEWLSVGWLAYVRGKLKKEADIKRFAENISKKGVKKLGQLSNSKLFEEYNYSEEYACALVEYIVETYGMEKFTEFYKNPKDIQEVFGIPKFIFNNDVKAFIYRRYTDKQMLMAMDEKGVDEITEIHFVQGGGVDITTDKEVEQPEIKERV